MSTLYRSTNTYLNQRQQSIRTYTRYGYFVLGGIALFVIGVLVGLFTAKQWANELVLIAFILLGSIVLVALAAFYWQREWGIELSRFESGVKAEESVRDTLERLPDVYTVFHNLVLPQKRGNVDFVVVGPTGLLAVEAKGHKGFFGFNRGVLTKNGRPLEKNFINQTIREAEQLESVLLSRLHLKLTVLPVLVFANPRATLKPATFVIKQDREVLVTHEQFLNDTIKQCTGQVNPQDQTRIIQLLRSFIE